jgi:hypothetical protein
VTAVQDIVSAAFLGDFFVLLHDELYHGCQDPWTCGFPLTSRQVSASIG